MKLKRYSYIIVLILVLFIGMNSAYAADIDCNAIFGSGEGSLRELINDVLKYPKIIVPILLILLGTLDFAKAVIASKEDEMKKAQSTFIKRVIAAVGVFFVPVIVDLLMTLADMVWIGTGYSSCGF